jgi:hypothetical protein
MRVGPFSGTLLLWPLLECCLVVPETKQLVAEDCIVKHGEPQLRLLVS